MKSAEQETQALLEQLRSEGHLEWAPDPKASGSSVPWFIALLQGGAGWLAAGLLLLFVGVSLQPGEPSAWSVLGIVALAGARALLVSASIFSGQLALALCLAGQACLLAAVGDATESATATSAFGVALELVVLILMPHKLLRFLSSLFALGLWIAALRFTFFGKDWLPDGGSSPGRLLLFWFLGALPALGAAVGFLRAEARWLGSVSRRVVRPFHSASVLALGFFGPLLEGSEVWERSDAVGLQWLLLWPLLSFLLSGVGAAVAFELRSLPLFGAAALSALGHVGHFSYLLGTSLLQKSLMMLAMGSALCFVGALLRSGRMAKAGLGDVTSDDSKTSREARQKLPLTELLSAAGGLLVLLLVNWSIYQKEHIKTSGETLYLELAPVDPRSLMQGDYMALNFALAREIESKSSGRVGVTLDERRIARLTPPGQMPSVSLRYRVQPSGIWLGTNAYFFEEGTAERYEGASYGEFRVDRESGEAILVALCDAEQKPL